MENRSELPGWCSILERLMNESRSERIAKGKSGTQDKKVKAT